jgi:hypothetical protein
MPSTYSLQHGRKFDCFTETIIMNEKNDRDKNRHNNEAASSKPDPGTLHNTDPQKNMEGPVSSLMHDTGEQFDSEETPREADEKKEKNM